MDLNAYLANVTSEFHSLKRLANGAIEQINDEAFFARPDERSNSIAIIIKHVAGNMISRWTDFLTTDGEKPDRNRETEFIIDPKENRQWLMAYWERGWTCLFDAVGALAPDDLTHNVTIRSELHSVPQAINRQLTHYAYHVGQIVLLARHLVGNDWKYLSIPPGKSEEFNRKKMRG